MTPRKIMFIRHGEKPAAGEPGFQEDGTADKKSLAVPGWARAGALVAVFTRPGGWAGLATPLRIFAAGVEGDDSQRPRETVVPLARKLGVSIDDRHGKDDLDALLGALMTAGDPGEVLVSWEHKALAKALSRGGLGPGVAISGQIPQQWPDDRFDVVWVFDRDSDREYRFSQVPQLLLAGDLPGGIPLSGGG